MVSPEAEVEKPKQRPAAADELLEHGRIVTQIFDELPPSGAHGQLISVRSGRGVEQRQWDREREEWLRVGGSVVTAGAVLEESVELTTEWQDIVTARVEPPSETAKIRLSFSLFYHQLTSVNLIEYRVRHGEDVIVPTQLLASARSAPTEAPELGFTVNAPGSTDEQAYTLQMRIGALAYDLGLAHRPTRIDAFYSEHENHVTDGVEVAADQLTVEDAASVLDVAYDGTDFWGLYDAPARAVRLLRRAGVLRPSEDADDTVALPRPATVAAALDPYSLGKSATHFAVVFGPANKSSSTGDRMVTYDAAGAAVASSVVTLGRSAPEFTNHDQIVVDATRRFVRRTAVTEATRVTRLLIYPLSGAAVEREVNLDSRGIVSLFELDGLLYDNAGDAHAKNGDRRAGSDIKLAAGLLRPVLWTGRGRADEGTAVELAAVGE